MYTKVCKKSCHLQELPLAVPYGWFGKWQVLCIVKCEEIFLSTLRTSALSSTMSPMEIRFNFDHTAVNRLHHAPNLAFLPFGNGNYPIGDGVIRTVFVDIFLDFFRQCGKNIGHYCMSGYGNFCRGSQGIGALQNDTCFQLMYQFRCQITEKGEFISFLFVIGRMSELLVEDTVICDQKKSGRLTVKASDRRSLSLCNSLK